jgi:hypothetical protein
MTIVNFVTDYVDNFDENDYEYTLSYQSNVKTEDLKWYIDEYDISTDTITITFRDENTAIYILDNWQTLGWFDLKPITNTMWSRLFSPYFPLRTNIYYYQHFFNVVYIQFNQGGPSILTFDGNNLWLDSTDLYGIYSLTLFSSDIVK